VLCSECGKRPATFHYTKILNGSKTQFNLCEVCAREKKIGSFMGLENNFSFHQLLSGLLNFELQSDSNDSESFMMDLRCENCGFTYSQFSKIGRLGCSNCYNSFQTYLEPLLKRVHGHSIHRGKIPERTKGELKLVREIERLKQELSLKVKEEKFEEAANIRDKIKLLSEKLKEK